MSSDHWCFLCHHAVRVLIFASESCCPKNVQGLTLFQQSTSIHRSAGSSQDLLLAIFTEFSPWRSPDAGGFSFLRGRVGSAETLYQLSQNSRVGLPERLDTTASGSPTKRVGPALFLSLDNKRQTMVYAARNLLGEGQEHDAWRRR